MRTSRASINRDYPLHNVTIDRNWRILRLLEVAWGCLKFDKFFDKYFLMIFLMIFFTFLFTNFFPIFMMNILQIFLRIFLKNFRWFFFVSFKLRIVQDYRHYIIGLSSIQTEKNEQNCSALPTEKKMVTFSIWQPKKANYPSKES